MVGLTFPYPLGHMAVHGGRIRVRMLLSPDNLNYILQSFLQSEPWSCADFKRRFRGHILQKPWPGGKPGPAGQPLAGDHVSLSLTFLATKMTAVAVISWPLRDLVEILLNAA